MRTLKQNSYKTLTPLSPNPAADTLGGARLTTSASNLFIPKHNPVMILTDNIEFEELCSRQGGRQSSATGNLLKHNYLSQSSAMSPD